MPPLPNDQAGKYHNDMLGMTSDTVLRFTTLPRLMLTMLESDGWRRLERPLDHRVFENTTIEDWVLGKPWPGLHFPDWAMVYAVLGKNIEVGPQCIARLREAGAPTLDEAERVFRVKAAKDGAQIQPNGRPKKGSNLLPLPSKASQDPSRLAARLKKDHEDIFAALERGEYRSVRAAAKAAGIVKDKTPLQWLEHWWKKADAAEREQFMATIG